MALFIAGVVAGLVVEWLLYSFWWKSRKSAAEDVVVMTVSEAEKCANERSTLKTSVLDKDLEINHLHARVAMLEEVSDRTAQVRAGVKQSDVATATVDKNAAPAPSKAKSAPKKSPKPSAAKPKIKPTVKKEPVAKKELVAKAAVSAPKAAPKKKLAVKKDVEKAAQPQDSAANLRQLAKLKGVGPKLAELLSASGLDSVEKISTAKNAQLKAALETAGGRYANLDSSTWAAQAKLISTGDTAGLKKLQATLK